MKLIVKSTFIDKNDHTTMYRVGTVLDLNDEERCADLIKRGLCEVAPKVEEPEVAEEESDKSEEAPKVDEPEVTEEESDKSEEAPKVEEPEVAEEESDKSEVAPKVDEPKAAKPKRGGGSKGSKK